MKMRKEKSREYIYALRLIVYDLKNLSYSTMHNSKANSLRVSHHEILYFMRTQGTSWWISSLDCLPRITIYKHYLTMKYYENYEEKDFCFPLLGILFFCLHINFAVIKWFLKLRQTLPACIQGLCSGLFLNFWLGSFLELIYPLALLTTEYRASAFKL